jgi:thiol:disulfide interchange protein DsbD
LLATGYAWALEGKLRWRVPTLAESVGGVQHAPEGYSWQRWSAEAVTNARAEGRVVIVDFTANWCLTCNISVKPALESKAVIEKLKQVNAVALVADYTTYPDYITEELARFDRGGVPLVLVYPQDATKPPMILPDPLPYPAPYGPVVRAALDKAAQ